MILLYDELGQGIGEAILYGTGFMLLSWFPVIVSLLVIIISRERKKYTAGFLINSILWFLSFLLSFQLKNWFSLFLLSVVLFFQILLFVIKDKKSGGFG